MLKLKRRTVIKTMHMVTVAKSWNRAAITFMEFDGKFRKELVVKIDNPSDIREIRRNLNSIEQAWRDMLK